MKSENSPKPSEENLGAEVICLKNYVVNTEELDYSFVLLTSEEQILFDPLRSGDLSVPFVPVHGYHIMVNSKTFDVVHKKHVHWRKFRIVMKLIRITGRFRKLTNGGLKQVKVVPVDD